MRGLTGPKRPKVRQQLIDVREVFSLWDILQSKYLSVETMQIRQQLAHDRDLQVLLKTEVDSLSENIAMLENAMQDYGIIAPDRQRDQDHTFADPQIQTDESIARGSLVYLQEHVENLLRAFKSATTNDSVRELLQKLILKTAKDQDRFVRYLKAKGWIETPPLYKKVPPEVAEKLTTVEAANLWEHLTMRQDNLTTTELIHSLAHDADFRATLSLGAAQLRRSIARLEREIVHFGLPLPKKPAKITLTPADTEPFKDDHMYRTIFNGIQGVAILHAQALKESVFNDRVRAVFMGLLDSEIDFVNNYIKFGKLKGWLNPMPIYG